MRMCVHVCVRACVRARARACVRACLWVRGPRPTSVAISSMNASSHQWPLWEAWTADLRDCNVVQHVATQYNTSPPCSLWQRCAEGTAGVPCSREHSRAQRAVEDETRHSSCVAKRTGRRGWPSGRRTAGRVARHSGIGTLKVFGRLLCGGA